MWPQAACPGRQDRSKAEHCISLLSGSQVRQSKEHQGGRNESKLSQEEPPVMIVDGGKMRPPNHLDASA